MMMLIKWLTSSPFNMVVNNLFWAGCVVGRYDLIWAVAPAILCYVALLLYARVVRFSQLTGPVLLGVVIDTLYTATGVFQFEHHRFLLPLWMCLLWIAFATTLPLSLRLLGRNIWLGALTGALGFPFSYFLGYQLGAVRFGLALPWVIGMVALTWAVVLPLMYHWIERHRVPLYETV